jgi:hypothetical protein
MPHIDIKACWQQVMDLPKETFDVFIELNIRNTVFNTNVEKFPFEIIHFVLFFFNFYLKSTDVKSSII